MIKSICSISKLTSQSNVVKRAEPETSIHRSHIIFLLQQIDMNGLDDELLTKWPLPVKL